MKRWLLLTLAMCGFLFAQAADITSISNALKQGNSASLTGKFDKEADIALHLYRLRFLSLESVASFCF